jgi:hypothetical protein
MAHDPSAAENDLRFLLRESRGYLLWLVEQIDIGRGTDAAVMDILRLIRRIDVVLQDPPHTGHEQLTNRIAALEARVRDITSNKPDDE